MMAHTPGPWEASYDDKFMEYIVIDDNGNTVATCEDIDGDEGEANAYIMGAALEMYEALVEGEAYMRKDIPVDAEILYAHPVIVKMQKAIRKARGECNAI